MTLDFSRFDALTFDCYGTLIDWERGILDAVRALASGHDVTLPGDDAVLERFARAESEAEKGAWAPYRHVLEEVAIRLSEEMGFRATRPEAAAFAASVAAWPAFPDSPAALARLATRFRLAVVSNVDDDLFAGSAAQLGVDFDQVVTAQQVRSYKPAHAHFHEVLRRLDLPMERVLHVAQSLYHDIAPARELGFTCVWVNRRAGRPGGGATAPATATPHLEVPDLSTLASLAVG